MRGLATSLLRGRRRVEVWEYFTRSTYLPGRCTAWCRGKKRQEEARIANLRIYRVIKGLKLRLNEDKSFCIVIGSRKQRQEVKLELERQPLMSRGFETQLKDKFKLWGQILSTGGLADSAAATVEAREGKIRGACLDISSIVNDWRAKVV